MTNGTDMTNIFAVFLKLPFEKKTLCVYEQRGRVDSREGRQFLKTQKLVCLNLEEYLQSINSGAYVPSTIFDVNTAVRLLNGQPAAKYNRDSTPWKGMSCLGKHFIDNATFKSIKAIENGKFGNYSEWIRTLPGGWARQLINALKKEHSRVITELGTEGLLDRFLNVEMPLVTAFAKEGVQGIQVNQEKLYSKYCQLDSEYYDAVSNLEIKHNFIVDYYSDQLSFSKIQYYIPDYQPEDFSKKYFWESIELMQETSDFLKSLLLEHRNSRDMDELLRISAAISGTCRVEYDIFGTVTGRILLNRPGIQYLKRSSRDIFAPSSRNEFIYADYSQFEPGILAWVSGDRSLIDLYNEGDIYSGLTTEIGHGCTRKVAKEIFLSFVYGMTRDNIRLRITKNFGEEAAASTDAFFDRFVSVDRWKNEIVEEVKRTHVAKGPYCYLRKVSSDDTDNDIARWAPNHIIQSTASGIFKDSLLEIASRFNFCRLLVPMHDAILIECPSSQVAEVRQAVEEIMITCFERTCSGIRARISFSPFSS
jgi:DNA polymerase I-like protein with 3'-5' exonuclease and polymerase domains